MLERGRVAASGDVDRVVREFRLAMLRSHAGYQRADATREVEVTAVELLDPSGAPVGEVVPGDPLVVQVETRVNRPVPDPVVWLSIHDATDQRVFSTSTELHGVSLDASDGAKQRIVFRLGSIPFVEGRHFVSIGVRDRERTQVYDWHVQQYPFEIAETAAVSTRLHIPTDVRVEPL